MFRLKTIFYISSKNFLPQYFPPPIFVNSLFLPKQKFWVSSNRKPRDEKIDKNHEVAKYIQIANQLNQATDFSGALENYSKALKLLSNYHNHQTFIRQEEAMMIGQIHLKMGIIRLTEANLEDALFSFQKARDLFSNCSSMEEVVAECFSQTGSIYLELDYPELAIKDLKKSIEIYEYQNKEDEVLKVLNILIQAYHKTQNFAEAINSLKKYLKIQIKQNGEEFEETANTYAMLGQAMIRNQNVKGALEAFNKALQIKVKLFGPTHLELSDCYSHIGMVYATIGDNEEALENLETSLWIKENSLGKDDISLVVNYVNIADAYSNINNFEKAIENYEQALKVNKKNKKVEKNSYIFYKMGLVYLQLKEQNGAVKKFEEGIKAKMRSLDQEEVPDFADFYEAIGLAYFQLKKYELALQYFIESLRNFVREKGENCEEVCRVYAAMGLTQLNLKIYDDAIESYKNALACQKGVFGEDSWKLGYNYHGLANVYARSKQYEKAIEYYRKANDRLLKELKEESPYFACLHTDMGFVLREMEKYDEAISNYEKAMNILIGTYGIGHQDTVRLEKELQMLYQKQGKFDKLRWLQTLMNYRI